MQFIGKQQQERLMILFVLLYYYMYYNNIMFKYVGFSVPANLVGGSFVMSNQNSNDNF